jgi:hypothetical protein
MQYRPNVSNIRQGQTLAEGNNGDHDAPSLSHVSLAPYTRDMAGQVVQRQCRQDRSGCDRK